jgi:hypothetical protein
LAQLTAQKISQSGLSPTYSSAASGGETFPNDGKTFFHVKNGDTTSKTVTIVAQNKCNQGFLHDLEVTVAASGEKIIGPFQVERFTNDAGVAKVTYSAVTSVTVAALKS